MVNPCKPTACGSCPLSGGCGEVGDLPDDGPDFDPNEPGPGSTF